MSQKLSKVQLKVGEGIIPPGEPDSFKRFEIFKDEHFGLTWNPEAHTIAIMSRKTGTVRCIDQSKCMYWDPMPSQAAQTQQNQQSQGGKR